jgi:hypothetical protein
MNATANARATEKERHMLPFQLASARSVKRAAVTERYERVQRSSCSSSDSLQLPSILTTTAR